MSTIPPPYPTRDQIRAQRRMMKEQMRMHRYQMRSQLRGMRRSSILRPILLITVGVIALLIQTGRIPGYQFWGWYGRWWPLLLVGAGAVLLLEWGIDRATNPDGQGGRPVYGGGIGFLIFVLVIAGIAAGASHQVNWEALHSQMDIGGFSNWGGFMGAKHESEQSLVLALPASAGVTIESARGDVTVTGFSDDGQLHIQMHKRVYTNSDSDADSRTKALDPQTTSSGGKLDVRIPSVENSTEDIVVSLPATASLDISAHYGDVKVSNVKGPVTAGSQHGDMQMDAIFGSVRAHMTHGDFSAHAVTGPVQVEGHMNDVTISEIDGPVTMDGDFFGDTHLEHIRGTMHFHSSRTDFEVARLDGSMSLDSGDLTADSVLGPVKLKTRSKDVALTQIAGDVQVENSNGDVTITAAPPLGTVEVDSHHGGINLTVPDESSFTVQANTGEGDVQTDFSGLTQQSGKGGSLSGRVGTGSAHIRLNVDKGDITLRKAVIAPLSPLPPMPKLSLTPPALPPTPALPKTPATPKLPKLPKVPAPPKPAVNDTHEY